MGSYLITGVCGFIGSKVAELLLSKGHAVVGLDNMNRYYDVRLKEYRLSFLKSFKNFSFFESDIRDFEGLRKVFERHRNFGAVFHLAAMAGVRYSIRRPEEYMTVNVNGTLNLLELCKKFEIPKFILASTSSLYAGQSMPFSENLPVNTPISPYAASKKAAEVLAYTYHYLYGINVTVLRYFTVYGPAGRPDMSVFRFVYSVLKGSPLVVYGDGSQSRDFTYIDDIAAGTVLALGLSGYEIINLGSNSPCSLKDLISLIEELVGKKADITYQTFDKTDMLSTWASIDKARELLGWQPKVGLKEGLKKTVSWFKENWEWVKEVNILKEGW